MPSSSKNESSVLGKSILKRMQHQRSVCQIGVIRALILSTMKDTKYIDLNADLGEGMGNDARLMPYLSSCNIACGGHFGDEESVRNAIRLAKAQGVKIGAHPSFPDKINFGRTTIEITPDELRRSLIEQIGMFLEVAAYESVTVNHIKSHGALYNLAAEDKKTAELICSVINYFEHGLKIYAPRDSEMASAAVRSGIKVVYEAFADRVYNDDLSLVSRSKPNALIIEPRKVFEQVKHLAKSVKVITVNGIEKRLEADTFCLHGDSENAVEILRYLDRNLKIENIRIYKSKL